MVETKRNFHMFMIFPGLVKLILGFSFSAL